MKRKLKIGFTYGDPASIGPEILLETFASWNYKNITPILIGDNKIYKPSSLKKLDFLQFEEVSLEKSILLGKPNKESGKHAYLCLKKAASLIQGKKIDFLITGPVSKNIASLYSQDFKGQTEALTKFLNIKKENSIMSFIERDLRIALFTRHISIKEIPKHISIEKIISFSVLLNSQIIKHLKIKNPKICLLGLNPHAGENGLIGKEEINIISKAVEQLNKKGLNVIGLLSPDATLAEAGRLYLKKKKQKYDFIISLYHDQSLPMFKAVSGFRGLNVTLGLPVLRVSPDHGTAFDIAGKHVASNEGIVSAIEFLQYLFQ